MDLSWILLAFFLVALIRGMTKALSKSMLKNSLRLGAVVVAFLITFALQVGGVYQNAIASVVELINLAAMLPMLAGAADLIAALASTIASPIIFVITFFPILWILRLIISIVCRAIENNAKEKAQTNTDSTPACEPEIEAEAEESSDAAESSSDAEPAADEPVSDEGETAPASEETTDDAATEVATEACENAEPEITAEVEETAPEAETATEAETAPEAEEIPEPAKEIKPKKEKKKKKSGFYEECAWKKAISVATGAIASLLTLAVFLMPMFYLMSVASTVTHALDNSDADDSQVYKAVEVVDEYVVDPYENSFVYKFYDIVAITDLLEYTTKAGGKITLDNGTVVYADEVLKGILTHGVSAAAQVTSVKSTCPTIKSDIQALVGDPMISSIAADVLMGVIADLEMSEPAEGDFAGAFINSLIDHYKTADKAAIENDLHIISGVAGVLAEEKVVIAFIAGEDYLNAMLGDGEFLSSVINKVISDETITPLLVDYLMIAIECVEVEEPAEDDLMGGLIANFADHYKTADRAIIESDLKALGNAVGVLAEQEILSALASGNVDFEEFLADRGVLGDIVEAISGLSAFTPTVEGAFELGIGMLGEALHIPENDAQVYDEFTAELVAAMVKSPDSKYNYSDWNSIQGFVKYVGDHGEKVTKYKGTADYDKFMSFYEQWKVVQAAFAHASEDRSFGYFSMQIQGNWYVYDNTYKTIVKMEGDAAEQYKNKICNVAGVINALTRYASVNAVDLEYVYSVLDAYAQSTGADEVSRELANRILAKDGFVSSAVTLEKLNAATDFSAWSDEAVKAQDSRLCVDIIMDLLGIMETLGNIEGVGGIEGAGQLADYFVVLGATFDVMEQTSCINELPELLIEGLIKSDMISDFIAPSFAFQSIEIVNNNDTKNYVDVMTTVTSIIKMGINSFGGMMK